MIASSTSRTAKIVARRPKPSRRGTRTAILRAVHGGLESNAAELQTALKAIPEGNLLYPLFDVTGWELVSQVAAFTTLSESTIQRLAGAYNRMKTANEVLASYKDLYHGPTSILATSAAAPHLDDPKVHDSYEMFYSSGRRLAGLSGS